MTGQHQLPNRALVAAYQVGVRLRQTLMLHDRAALHPCATSGTVHKVGQLLAASAVAFEELCSALGVAQTLRTTGGQLLSWALSAWSAWVAEDPDERSARSPARGYLDSSRALVEEIVAASPTAETWLALGLEIPRVYHAGVGRWPWRWNDLRRLKEHCARAGVGLPRLVVRPEGHVIAADEPRYPEDLRAWYWVEAGLRKLRQQPCIPCTPVPAPPPAPPVPATVSGPALAKKARALTLLYMHPDWTDTRIAEEAGVSRTTLYDWDEFKAARAVVKEAKYDLPRGSRDREGRVEAWVEPEDQDDGD